MKNASPGQISSITSIIITGIILAILLLVKLFFPDHISWILVLTISTSLLLPGCETAYYGTMEKLGIGYDDLVSRINKG